MAKKEPDSQVETKDTDQVEVIESDQVVTEEPKVEALEEPAKGLSPKSDNKSKAIWKKLLQNKRISIPAGIVLLVAALFAIPPTRYAILSNFISQNFSILVTDSQTGKPVSSASITWAGKPFKTDKDGKANIKVKVGNSKVVIQKKYYKDISENVLVSLSKPRGPLQVKLEATGRQVPVVIKNKITGKPIENALIKAADTEAKTDKDGKVTIVLPPSKDKIDAVITANGYNEAKAVITVTDKELDSNTFNITPSGKIYFLSKLSGKIDVVKTDLDGANRQTVLAGTGKEEDRGTVMLASRDWKYLALLSKRDSDLPKLYLIETSNDKLTTMDEGNASFTLTGWVGQNFVYTVNRKTVGDWQPKRVALKSYNAPSKKINLIDENQGVGTQYDYAVEEISWVTVVGHDSVVYFKTWTSFFPYAYGKFTKLEGKKAQLISAKLDPTISKKTLKDFALSSQSGNYPDYYSTYLNPLSSYNYSLYEPNELYFSIYEASGTRYFEVEGDKTQESAEAKLFFEESKPYPTYLLSPNGQNTFWSESRDGKETLLVGGDNGQDGKQIASLSELTQYGWYTDNYLLVAKKGSELYILSRDGGTPFKVTDYHRPNRSYYGYGGGYGGI